MTTTHKPRSAVLTLMAASVLTLSCAAAVADPDLDQKMKDPDNWAAQAGDYANHRWSDLKQIDAANVGKLQVAWTMSTGVLRGQSEGNLMVIAYIPQTDDVSSGDVVLTSGLGGIYPEGLVVGKVSRVQRNDADPFQAAVVEAAVPMDKLERLYVLSDSGQ